MTVKFSYREEKQIKMNSMDTFASRLLRFNRRLADVQLDLPKDYTIINPYRKLFDEYGVKNMTSFYEKYYNDNYKRMMILGSSPARRRSAVSGVPFLDASLLKEVVYGNAESQYLNAFPSDFFYTIIMKFGGWKSFFSTFYMNFVCPLGIVRTKSDGRVVNANYYEKKELCESMRPFLIKSLREQMGLGIDASICYCIGCGENYRFLLDVNNQYGFFNTIIPLEHPRFIMQYNSKDRDFYEKKYLSALKNQEI